MSFFWDYVKTQRLIEDYRNNRVLWDVRDPDYVNSRKKVKVWQDLSGKYQCSVRELKIKVKNLRTCYHRVRKQKVWGMNKWAHYAAMRFLAEVEDKIRIRPPGQSGQVTPDEDNEVDDDETDQHQEQSFIIPDVTPEIVIKEEVIHTPSDVALSKLEPASTGTKRKLQTNGTDVDVRRQNKDHGIRRVEEKNETLQKTAEARCEFSVYGEYVANELRKLSGHAQAIAKHQINNVLFEAAMGKFDPPPSQVTPVLLMSSEASSSTQHSNAHQLPNISIKKEIVFEDNEFIETIN